MLVYFILVIQICILLFYTIYFLINICKKYLVEMIDKNDKEKFKYYRDILKDYSIGELGYLFNGNKPNILIIAELESLKMKKYLVTKDKEIFITNNDKNISNSEKYILDHYKFIKDNQFKTNYIKCIENSLKEKNCIKNYRWKASPKLIIIFMLFVFSCLVGFFLALRDTFNVTFFIAEMIIFLVTWVICLISMMCFKETNNIVKTPIGKNIYLKLNGLKKYIKDFGNFDDYNLKEILLWEEYILYAIILNESKNLIQQAKDEYNNLVNIVY